MGSALHIGDPLAQAACRGPVILIDGVIFQIYANSKGGIARVWMELIPRLSRLLPDCTLLFLRRDGTTVTFEDLAEVEIPRFYSETVHELAQDEAMLGHVCSQFDADLFISTYYTTAQGFPSILMAHDLIPEEMNYDMTLAMWASKERAFLRADSFVAVSESTRRDLHKHYGIPLDSVAVARHGVSGSLRQTGPEAVAGFRSRHGIDRPYFLTVGLRGVYKNCAAAVEALLSSDLRQRSMIVMVGGEELTEGERVLYGESVKRVSSLPDEDLAAAYSGACALLYPSLYEGFGIPILEAFACGCPVITTRAASLPEAGGDACVYVDTNDVESLRSAMERMMDESTHARHRELGLQRVKDFSWERSAGIVSDHIRSRLEAYKPRIDARVEQVRNRESAISDIRALIDSGERPRASVTATQTVAAHPSSFRVFLTAAESAGLEGNSEDACDFLQRAWELAPHDHRVVEEVARQLMDRAIHEAATGMLFRYLDDFPNDARMVNLCTSAINHWATGILAQSEEMSTATSHAPEARAAVVAVGSGSGIADALTALSKQTIAGQIEVVAISQDASAIFPSVYDAKWPFRRLDLIRPPHALSQPEAVNLGLTPAKAEYCAFVSCDDRLTPDALEVLAAGLDESPENLVSFGTTHLTEQPDATVERYTPIVVPEANFQVPVANVTDQTFSFGVGPFMLWRRMAHEVHGMLNPRWGRFADIDFWVRIGRTHRPKHVDRMIRLRHGATIMQKDEVFELKTIIDIYASHHNLTHKFHMANLLMKLVIVLVELREHAEVRKLYGEYRDILPPMVEMQRIDELMSRVGR